MPIIKSLKSERLSFAKSRIRGHTHFDQQCLFYPNEQKLIKYLKRVKSRIINGPLGTDCLVKKTLIQAQLRYIER